MQNNFYQSIESITESDSLGLQECLNHLNFNEQDLIPVITQSYKSKDILMHAWMNRAAIEKTLITQRMTYWSRSRNTFWVKGETSGHIQKLVAMHIDCDGDTILCQVEQTGPACHTGRSNCFYLKVNNEKQLVNLALPL